MASTTEAIREKKAVLVRWLAVCGMAAPPVLLLFEIVGVAVTPGYDRVSQTASQLSAPGVPYPEIMRMGYVVYSILIFCLAVGLANVLEWNRKTRVALVLLFLYSASGIIAGIFKSDSQEIIFLNATEDIIHDSSAFFAVLCIGAVVATLSYGTRGMPEWQGLPKLAIMVLAGGILLALPFPLHFWPGVHGILERALFAVTVFWIEVLSFRVYGIALANERVRDPGEKAASSHGLSD